MWFPVVRGYVDSVVRGEVANVEWLAKDFPSDNTKRQPVPRCWYNKDLKADDIKSTTDVTNYSDEINKTLNSHRYCRSPGTCDPKKATKYPRCRLARPSRPKQFTGPSQLRVDKNGKVVSEAISPGPGAPPDSYPFELPDDRVLAFDIRRYCSDIQATTPADRPWLCSMPATLLDRRPSPPFICGVG